MIKPRVVLSLALCFVLLALGVAPTASVSQENIRRPISGVSIPTPLVDYEADTGFGGFTNGQAVSTWPDQSGNANDALQTVAGATYRTADGPGGRPAIRWNATAFFHFTNNIAVSAYTIFVVFKTTGGTARCFLGSTTSSGIQICVGNSPTSFDLYSGNFILAGSGTTALSTVAFQQSNVTISTAPAGNFRLASAANGSYSASLPNTQPLQYVGTDGSGINRYSGDWCLFRIYGSVLSLAQIQAVEAEILARWGV
jgi:hypothetical protein